MEKTQIIEKIITIISKKEDKEKGLKLHNNVKRDLGKSGIDSEFFAHMSIAIIEQKLDEIVSEINTINKKLNELIE